MPSSAAIASVFLPGLRALARARVVAARGIGLQCSLCLQRLALHLRHLLRIREPGLDRGGVALHGFDGGLHLLLGQRLALCAQAFGLGIGTGDAVVLDGQFDGLPRGRLVAQLFGLPAHPQQARLTCRGIATAPCSR